MTDLLDLSCPDVDATRRVAAAVAGTLEPGDVVLLDGDLGVGKTTFTQGLASALGVDEAVTSPTFTLARAYRTRHGFDLWHVDVYRLERAWEIVDLGLSEVLDEGAVVVVEWGQRAASVLGREHLDVSIALQGTGDARRVTLSTQGARWERREPLLTASLAGAVR